MTTEIVAMLTNAAVENSNDVVTESNDETSYAKLSYWNGCIYSARE